MLNESVLMAEWVSVSRLGVMYCDKVVRIPLSCHVISLKPQATVLNV